MNDKQSISDSQDQPNNILELFHFRQLVIPGDVFAYFVDGTITITEMLLLCMIDAAVKVRGEGCFLTNQTLADNLRVKHVQNIQEMKQKLTKLGLIRSVGRILIHGRGRNVLETKWSRIRLKGDPDDSEQAFRSFNTVGNTVLKLPYSSSLHSEEKRQDMKPAYSVEQATHKENTMPFGMIESPSKVSERAQELYNEIRQTALSKKWFVSNSIQKKAKQIQILINKHGEEEVTRIVYGYTRGVKDGTILKPQIGDGEQFKKRYDWIKETVEKIEKANPTIELTKEGKRILSHLPESWPCGAEKDLPKAVQLTYNFFCDFSNRLDGANRVIPTYRAFAERIQNEMLDPLGFTITWFKEVFDQVSKWERWSGNIMWFVPNEEHPKFNTMGEQWAKGYFAEANGKWAKFIVGLYGKE